MHLVDHEIRQLRKEGAIVIEPFHEDQLMPQSYDLTLGPWFYRYEPRRPVRHMRVFPFNLKHPERQFVGPLDARRFEDVIELEPGERILGHTNEVVGGQRANFMTCCNVDLATTSTAARIGISAHPSAGHGDPGFVNRWTLEISNDCPITIKLPVGAIICQALFSMCKPPEHLYNERKGSGRYQDGAWKPEHMVPKALKVRDWWKDLYD